MLGPVSLLIGTATSPITRRLAGESAETYRSMLRGGLRTRPEVLLVGLAWLVALIPWFLLCLGIDVLGALMGRDRGWFGLMTLPGIVAIGVAAIYYGLRAYLAREPISVRRVEDSAPVLAYAVTVLIMVVSGVT